MANYRFVEDQGGKKCAEDRKGYCKWWRLCGANVHNGYVPEVIYEMMEVRNANVHKLQDGRGGKFQWPGGATHSTIKNQHEHAQ